MRVPSNPIVTFAFLVVTLINCIRGGGNPKAFNPCSPRVAIDYGPRFIGIARSDILGVVHPQTTLANHGDLVQISNEIVTLAKSWKAQEIIVGVPLDSDGVIKHYIRNINGRICLNFSRVLNCIALNDGNDSSLQTFLFDERFTTKEAKIRMKEGRYKVSLDAMSAACLLERYIEDTGSGRLEALTCDYPPPLELARFDYEVIRAHVQEQFRRRIKVPSEQDGKMKALKFGHRRQQRVSNTQTSSSTTNSALTSNTEDDASKEKNGASSKINTSCNGSSNNRLDNSKVRRTTVAASYTSNGMVDSISEEEVEEDESIREYMQIVAQRRKKGTLRKRSQGS